MAMLLLDTNIPVTIDMNGIKFGVKDDDIHKTLVLTDL